MRTRIAAPLLAALLAAHALPIGAQQPTSIELPYDTFSLPNGLKVIVHEERSTPLAAVNVWYHVGSMNERPGRTGFAHLFEHLMFEGSANVPEGQIDQLILTAGGATPNGSTAPDRTNYYEVVPATALELALWIEADRMGWLLQTMTKEKLDAQREVVKNERREGVDNQPYGLAEETLLANLYPADHPYHWPTIGSLADLDAASFEDVQNFFRTYYAPNNATLTIAGAADVDAVKRLVTKYFSEIPRGPAVPPVQPPPATLSADKYVTLEDRVQLPRLYIAWHTPAFYAPGDAALDVVANVLAGGKTSRLYRTLVYERKIAQDVSAFQSSQKLGSTFNIIVTAVPGVSLDSLEAVVRAELQKLASGGVEERELQRAQNQIEISFVDALQAVEGKADRLNHYYFYTGDPGYAERDLQRYRSLTAADVQQVAASYLANKPAVLLSIVPTGQTRLAAVEGR